MTHKSTNVGARVLDLKFATLFGSRAAANIARDLGPSPNLVRDFDAKLEFAPLVVEADVVSVDG